MPVFCDISSRNDYVVAVRQHSYSVDMNEQEKLRREAGHTLKSLAEATGLSERTVWQWSQGHSVSPRTLKLIEDELKFTTPPSVLEQKKVALGKAIRAARLQAGMSTYQLADAAGLAQKTVQDFENAVRHPYPVSLTAIEKALGLQAGILEQILDRSWPGKIEDIHPATLFGKSETVPIEDEDLLTELGRRLQMKDQRIKMLEDQLEALQNAIRGVVPQDIFDLAADDPGTPSAGQRMADEDQARGEEPQA